jgi:cytochrome c556
MRTTTLIAAALLAAMLPAFSHDHATGVVRERMELMEGMAKRMKAMRARIEGKRERAAILTDAKALAASAGHVTHLFPPGSTQPPTEATAAIWQNWPGFERIARALEAESAKLAGMNPDDLAALNAQYRVVSRTCGDCHELYRVKK